MDERTWWNRHVRKRWHDSHRRWTALKVEDNTNGGFPDTVCSFDGDSALIELKYAEKLPVKGSSKIHPVLSAPQARHLELWAEQGKGLGLICLGIQAGYDQPDRWCLYNWNQWPEGEAMTKDELYGITPLLASRSWATLDEVPLWVRRETAQRRRAPQS